MRLSTYPFAQRHVFLGRRGPLTQTGIDRALYLLRDEAGARYFTGVRVSAHTCRHTFAVNFLAAGGDVYRLARLMGHSAVAVTERYLAALSAPSRPGRAAHRCWTICNFDPGGVLEGSGRWADRPPALDWGADSPGTALSRCGRMHGVGRERGEGGDDEAIVGRVARRLVDNAATALESSLAER